MLKKIILVLTLTIGIGIVIQQIFSSSSFAYRCLDLGYDEHVRCLHVSEPDGECYGYYELRGNSYTEGIIIPEGITSWSTCEGFGPEKKADIFYSVDGSYIK